MKDILFLHSSNMRNNTHYLDENINGQYKLLSFSFTNNLFNVNETNNKIYFREGVSDLVATLTNGYYDITSLKDNISSAMNNVATGTISVSIDTDTNKYTITNPFATNFYFTFGTNTSNSSRKLLGFNENNGTHSTSHTSNIPVDLNLHQNIFIKISEDNKKYVVGENYFNTSLIISGTASFGETLRYINDDNYNQYINIKNTKQIHILIHDKDYNTLNLNSEYSLILQKC